MEKKPNFSKLFYLEKKEFVIEMIEDSVNKNPVMFMNFSC